MSTECPLIKTLIEPVLTVYVFTLNSSGILDNIFSTASFSKSNPFSAVPIPASYRIKLTPPFPDLRLGVLVFDPTNLNFLKSSKVFADSGLPK
jgi:hypothetical protein